MGPSGEDDAGSPGGRPAPADGSSGEAAREIQLGAFCAEAVDALAKDKGRDADTTVTEAVRTYLAGVRGNEADWRVPSALAEFEAAVPQLTIELRLEEAELVGLTTEAARQGVSPGRLVEQAVIVAYAELDRRRS